MKTEEVIKYLALAVGGYLLYKWLADNCYLSQFGITGQYACQNGQPIVGVAPGSTTGVVTSPTQQTATAPTGTTASTVTAPPVGLTPAQAAAAQTAAQTASSSQLTTAAQQLLAQAAQLRSVAAQLGQSNPQYASLIAEAQSVEAQAASFNSAAANGGSTTVAPTQDTLTAIQNAASLGDPTSIALSDQDGIRYTADQWNYIRVSAGGDATNVDLFPTGNRGYLMLASEYIRARQQANLSGLHGLYGMATLGRSRWTN